MRDEPHFDYDVFLSHSSKDKPIVRDIAERLKKDGIKVWFDEWEIPKDELRKQEAESALHPSSFILHPLVEEGLERSRVLVICMSAHAFGSDWAQLESGTFRFRDPLNKERRFLPLRLDDAPIKGSLAQFLYINWLTTVREQEYAKLLEACRPLAKSAVAEAEAAGEQVSGNAIQLDYKAEINAYAFSPDGKHVLSGAADNTVRLWEVESGRCLRVLEGHTGEVHGVAWSADQNRALSAAKDKTVRYWDLEARSCLRVLKGHEGPVKCVEWSPDQLWALSSGWGDRSARIWDLATGNCVRELRTKLVGVYSIAWRADQKRVLSACFDHTLLLWEVETGRCLRVLEGHTGFVYAIVFSPDQSLALSGSADKTVRLWNVEAGRCLRVLEGHTEDVQSVACNANQLFALSGSHDTTVRLWDVETGRCLRVFKGHKASVKTVAWSADGRHAFSADEKGGIRIWDLSEFVTETRAPKVIVPAVSLAPDQVQYTNAKVLLVGESGAGKTGLSKRLALNDWQPSDSTVGAWATQWKLPVSGGKGVEREVWLWDFGGQADQRLIHQLYMDETALAVLVFDGQKEDLFETLGQWDRDLTRASRKEFAKLLVAGRVDAGGLRASRSEVEKFAAERKFGGFLETSAKKNLGCEELKQAILDAIPWDELPCSTTEVLFKRLKEEIIALKDEGRVLMRFNELRETLLLRLTGELARFADTELRAVLTLLAGPGVVWELAFGSWVLLQPERINAYAQAVIRTLQADEHQRGCLMEERVLKGDLMYESSMTRLEGDEERFVLLAMHQTLVERGLCLRQPTAKGNLLVFPSYYRKERADIGRYPSVHESYRFTGFLDEIYATLVVRLHNSDAFQHDELWRYAADFKTNTGKRLGIKLTRRAPSAGELEVYFDPAVAVEEKIVFSKYVHEHLLQHARDVERLRYYVCPKCGTPVGNREVAMMRLNDWLRGRPQQPEAAGLFKLDNKMEVTPSIICVACERRLPLWDELEAAFASPEIQERVRDMQEESSIELSNQSKERALIGEVISTVALADQISREFNFSDQGIDMEIEFNDDAHEATGVKLYLQLKAGDSYLRKRSSDGAEIFTLKNQRHAGYWMAQAFPVMLVIRSSEGEVRWMEVRDWLKRKSDNGNKPVKQIVFEGERFDVMSVRRWRERMLGGWQPARSNQPLESPDPEKRLIAIKHLIATQPNNVTRDTLVELAFSEPNDDIRQFIVTEMVGMWPDERTRDFLLKIGESDVFAEVRAISYEALSRMWWKTISVRRWLRSRISHERESPIQQRLLRAIENAGGQLAEHWKNKLCGSPSLEKEPEIHPGYPSFSVSRFRLANVGPFHDTGEVDLRSDVNVFLGDNAAGKTTILKSLALAAVGLPAANEVVGKDARSYLRKGSEFGSIEVIFEILPDPDSSPGELRDFNVGLQIDSTSSRFSPIPDSNLSLFPQRDGSTELKNSAEQLGALRTNWTTGFGFVAGYGAVRTFAGPRQIRNDEERPENEWVLSLFRSDAWLVNPEILTKLIRGDASNVEKLAPRNVSDEVVAFLRNSLKSLLPSAKTILNEGGYDIELNATSLRFEELSDGYRSLLALVGHWLRCSLRLCDWKSDPTEIHGIMFLDEIDLHLHPAWQIHVVQDFRKAFPNIQLIASTHSPLVIAELKKDNVIVMRRENDGQIVSDRPELDLQGQGVSGILTSVFDLSSTIDQPTLDKINRRLGLHSRRSQLSDEEKREYEELTDELGLLGFNREFSDPYFERFAVAMAKRREAVLGRLTPQERQELDEYANRLVAEITKEDEK